MFFRAIFQPRYFEDAKVNGIYDNSSNPQIFGVHPITEKEEYEYDTKGLYKIVKPGGTEIELNKFYKE